MNKPLPELSDTELAEHALNFIERGEPFPDDVQAELDARGATGVDQYIFHSKVFPDMPRAGLVTTKKS